MSISVNIGYLEVFAENSDSRLKEQCCHKLVFAMVEGLEKGAGLGRTIGSFVFNIF